MIKKILVMILGVSLVISGTHITKAQERDIPSEEIFEYSVTPADKEWSDFSSHQEMLDACQLPNTYLRESSTEELLEKVVKYPLIIDILSYNDIKTGVSAVAKQFNGLAELLSRKDIASVVANKYKQVKIPTEEHYQYNSDTIYNGSFLNDEVSRKNIYIDMQNDLETTLYEGILLQEVVVTRYSYNEKLSLLEEVEKKALERGESRVFDFKSQSQFINDVYKDKESLWWGILKSSVSSNKITSSKRKLNITIYNKNNARNRKGDSNVYVTTPNGTKIKCIVKSDNHVNSAKFVAKQKETYPNATVVGSGYSGNNCHAYAWTGRQDV